jgi:hypothetical protein
MFQVRNVRLVFNNKTSFDILQEKNTMTVQYTSLPFQVFIIKQEMQLYCMLVAKNRSLFIIKSSSVMFTKELQKGLDKLSSRRYDSQHNDNQPNNT